MTPGDGAQGGIAMSFWLSDPVESLVDAIASKKDDASCDVLVVGSGYGGSLINANVALKPGLSTLKSSDWPKGVQDGAEAFLEGP